MSRNDYIDMEPFVCHIFLARNLLLLLLIAYLHRSDAVCHDG